VKLSKFIALWALLPTIILPAHCFGNQLPAVTTAPLSWATAQPRQRQTFTNPILRDGADPWVIRHGDHYYYTCTSGGDIFVGKSPTLQTIGAQTKIVWIPPKDTPYSKNLWAPELHFLGGKWFVYFAADDGKNEKHLMYVLRAKTADPQGEYEFMGALDTGVQTAQGHEQRWAIDGNILSLNGRLYFVWSGWEGTTNVAQNLYIAPMSNPWTISGPRVLISKPELPWELNGKPFINEGPTALQRNGKTFIIYSASGSWGDDYCLGRLDLVGADPLNPQHWKKHPQAVFSKTADVFGPGHASFAHDGQRDWIIYHAAKFSGAGWNRNIRMQPFTWSADGTPHFGAPLSPTVTIDY
jgi:GH43 family beta-xylosidase